MLTHPSATNNVNKAFERIRQVCRERDSYRYAGHSLVTRYKTQIDVLELQNRRLLRQEKQLAQHIDSCEARTNKIPDLKERLSEQQRWANQLSLENVAWRDKCQGLLEKNSFLGKFVEFNFLGFTDMNTLVALY